MTIRERTQRFVKEASLFAWEAEIAFDEICTILGCQVIVATLKKHRGNQSAAARQLKMHRNTLSRWLISARKLGLEIPRLRGKGHLRQGRKPVGTVEQQHNLSGQHAG